MPSSKRSSRESVVNRKMWVCYRLQSLTTEQFIKITNQILRGENFLVKLPKIPEAS